MKESLPLAEVYAILEPGPVLLLSTALDGRINLMAQSWHTMLEFEPPLIGCVVGADNHSFAALDATGECVLNVPDLDLLDALVLCGNRHGDALDKFAACRLSAQPSAQVAVPRVEECWANLECRVRDRQLVASYNLFILEVVQAWRDPRVRVPRTLHHRGHGRFMVAGEEVQSGSRMR